MKAVKQYSLSLNQLTDHHRLTPAEDLLPWVLLGGLSPHTLQAKFSKPLLASVKAAELGMLHCVLAAV